MGSMSIWHWVIVALIVMLLFGKGRISEMMGDLAKGIKSFKKGLGEDEAAAAQAPAAQVTQQPAVHQQAAPQPSVTPDQAPR